jgi:hypothetical protein
MNETISWDELEPYFDEALQHGAEAEARLVEAVGADRFATARDRHLAITELLSRGFGGLRSSGALVWPEDELSSPSEEFVSALSLIAGAAVRCVRAIHDESEAELDEPWGNLRQSFDSRRRVTELLDELPVISSYSAIAGYLTQLTVIERDPDAPMVAQLCASLGRPTNPDVIRAYAFREIAFNAVVGAAFALRARSL